MFKNNCRNRDRGLTKTKARKGVVYKNQHFRKRYLSICDLIELTALELNYFVSRNKTNGTNKHEMVMEFYLMHVATITIEEIYSSAHHKQMELK